MPSITLYILHRTHLPVHSCTYINGLIKDTCSMFKLQNSPQNYLLNYSSFPFFNVGSSTFTFFSKFFLSSSYSLLKNHLGKSEVVFMRHLFAHNSVSIHKKKRHRPLNRIGMLLIYCTIELSSSILGGTHMLYGSLTRRLITY